MEILLIRHGQMVYEETNGAITTLCRDANDVWSVKEYAASAHLA